MLVGRTITALIPEVQTVRAPARAVGTIDDIAGHESERVGGPAGHPQLLGSGNGPVGCNVYATRFRSGDHRGFTAPNAPLPLMLNQPVPPVFAQNTPLDCPPAESPANNTGACVTGALITKRKVSAEPGIDAATRAGPHEVPESAVTPSPLVSATRAGVTFVSRTGTFATGTPSESTATIGVTDSPCFKVRFCGPRVTRQPTPSLQGPT